MENKKFILAAALCLLMFVVGIASWKIMVVLILILVAIAIVYMGPEKFLAEMKETFTILSNVGQKKLNEAKERSKPEILTIHDVEVKEIAGGMYELSIYTEKGKMTLEPRRFSSIPEVLTKGKTVSYKEIYSLDGTIKKEKSISAIGADGEERIFRIQ